MNKKVKIFLRIILILAIAFAAYVVFLLIFNTCCGIKPIEVKDNNITREQRLSDPNLLYSDYFSSGMCADGQGKTGGCYTDLYLYSTGILIQDSGFIPYNGKKQDNPVTQTQIDSATMSEVTKDINSVMKKDCPDSQIMDADWDYQINFQGVKKSFHNPPDDCKKIFDNINQLINPRPSFM